MNKLATLFKKEKPWEYYDQRMGTLFKTLVPDAFETDTLQGELCRCLCNVYDEGIRNGFVNWDDTDEDAVSYLKQHLSDPAVFDEKTIMAINRALENVKVAGPKIEIGVPFDDLKFLLCRTVDWCDAHPDLIRIKEEDEYLGHD